MNHLKGGEVFHQVKIVGRYDNKLQNEDNRWPHLPMWDEDLHPKNIPTLLLIHSIWYLSCLPFAFMLLFPTSTSCAPYKGYSS